MLIYWASSFYLFHLHEKNTPRQARGPRRKVSKRWDRAIHSQWAQALSQSTHRTTHKFNRYQINTNRSWDLLEVINNCLKPQCYLIQSFGAFMGEADKISQFLYGCQFQGAFVALCQILGWNNEKGEFLCFFFKGSYWGTTVCLVSVEQSPEQTLCKY